MIHPTIHLNGTSPEALRDAYEEALVAVRGAVRALAGCCPNPRDYYPQGDSAFVQAAQEHRERMRRLTETAGDLETLVNRVQDTIDERNAQ